MEGNVIERRTSTAQLWADARQQTVPSTSSASPGGVPAYSNIFVTPPDHEHRSHLERMKEVDKPEIAASKLSQIKDKHDGETSKFHFFFRFKLAIFILHFLLYSFGLTIRKHENEH